jgi:hypothetical protein
MENNNKNTKTIKVSDMAKCHLGVYCMICNEVVELTEQEKEMIHCGVRLPPKICDKCRKAILYMRSQMPEE